MLGESLYADELSTLWVVADRSLGDVISLVHGDTEITPPVAFSLSWLFGLIEPSPELLRAPAFIAGVAAIPLTYLTGARAVGRVAGVVGAALVALSPFMAFYSAEARGYGLAITFVLFSTFALLKALDSRRRLWWAAYGAATAAAMLTHYVTVFPLAGQLVWLLVSQERAWRPALVANGAAVLCFLPWTTGLLNDLDSPTTEILSRLIPFTLETIRGSVEHATIGYPYSFGTTRLQKVPGVPALVLFALGLVLGTGGWALLRSRVRASPADGERVSHGAALVLALALSAPVGAALTSAVGSNVFSTRTLGVSWPGFALVLGLLAASAGTRLRFVVSALLVASFAIAAVKVTEPAFGRPDYEDAAALIDREARPGDVVIDSVFDSPGPLSGLDAALERPVRVLRVGKPQTRAKPFEIGDPITPVPTVVRQATASGGRVFVVQIEEATRRARPGLGKRVTEEVIDLLEIRHRRVATHRFGGFLEFRLLVYAPKAS